MDIATLTLKTEPVRMVLQHPVTRAPLTDDAGNECALMVVGMESERYIEADRKISNRKLRQLEQRRKLTLTAEDVEAEALERLAATVVGIEHVVYDGKPLEYSQDAVRTLLALPWLREQLDAFVGDRANFMQG
jgi:hypothetical protein